MLDVAGFIVAMYLVQAVMSNHLKSIPSHLPPSIYQQATSYASSLNVPVNIYNPPSPPTIIPSTTFMTSPTRTVASHPPLRMTEEVKTTANEFFEVLDERQVGYLDQAAVRNHFMQCGLTLETFHRIW